MKNSGQPLPVKIVSQKARDYGEIASCWGPIGEYPITNYKRMHLLFILL